MDQKQTQSFFYVLQESFYGYVAIFFFILNVPVCQGFLCIFPQIYLWEFRISFRSTHFTAWNMTWSSYSTSNFSYSILCWNILLQFHSFSILIQETSHPLFNLSMFCNPVNSCLDQDSSQQLQFVQTLHSCWSHTGLELFSIQVRFYYFKYLWWLFYFWSLVSWLVSSPVWLLTPP